MSLNRRIILSASLVLLVFITLTAITLERAFVDSNESALRDTLTSQLYALMAVAEVEDNNIVMPTDELDALLGLPSSGLVAYITDKNENILWKSSSTLGVTPPQPTSLSSGEKHFSKTKTTDNKTYYNFTYGVDWATDTDNVALTFTISTDLKSFNSQIDQYRKTLWSWLIAMAMLLLISQGLILRWGLSPLQKVGAELSLIEAGKQEQIQQHYPHEIERLTNNINILLQQERNQKTRYRNALGDLAHSLKTPLAVLQSSLSNNNQDKTQLEQITRMNSIVEYQLQRAATAGSSNIGKPINVKTTTQRILESLHKVYREKTVDIRVQIDDAITFKGDEGDLMELLGNLLDNAFKWTNNIIIINASYIDNRLSITISDDGPGIKVDTTNKILERGIRADQSIAGHGIGLSIVQNIVEAYSGSLKIINNSSGGTDITILL